jgi:hypothetical protein
MDRSSYKWKSEETVQQGSPNCTNFQNNFDTNICTFDVSPLVPLLYIYIIIWWSGYSYVGTYVGFV